MRDGGGGMSGELLYAAKMQTKAEEAVRGPELPWHHVEVKADFGRWRRIWSPCRGKNDPTGKCGENAEARDLRRGLQFRGRTVGHDPHRTCWR